MGWTVANTVGRLLEMRIETMLRPEETQPFMAEVGRVLSAMPAGCIAISDLRGAVKAADPKTIDLIAGLMRSENPRTLRAALLLAESAATVQMQIERMVKAAGGDKRRLFRARADAEAWLGELLDDAERARLATFLDE